MAHTILLLLLAPALVLLTFAVAPRAVLLRRPAAALAQRHDDLIVLGIGWVVGWVLYIGLVYGLSIALD